MNDILQSRCLLKLHTVHSFQIVINNIQLKWNKVLRGQDITNCKSHPCISNPCGNNGVCEPDGPTYGCHCHLGYEGSGCKTGNYDVHSLRKP